MFNRGGQQRTIQSPCGFQIKGHPQEVDKKLIRHFKYCKDCKEIRGDAEAVYPCKFNKEAGLMNGWNGLKANGDVPQQMMTTAFIDGERFDVLTDAHNLQDAMNNEKLKEDLFRQIENPRKKKNKKNKKNKNDDDIRFIAVPDDLALKMDTMTEDEINEMITELLK